MTTHLSDEDVDMIVKLLDGWSGPLSWEDLRDAICIRSGQSPTRQALAKHTRILTAFQYRKKNPVDGGPGERSGNVAIEKLNEKIARLEAANSRLKRENDLLLDQFRRWAYNASIAGLSKKQLDEPLPEVDRRHAK